MEYKISKVGFFSSETYGKQNNHRVMVNFEGQEKDYSAFVSEKPNIGDVWSGEIKKAEKNDKIYWNFEFERNSSPRGNSSPTQAPTVDSDKIAREVRAVGIEVLNLKTTLTDMKGVLSDILAAMIKKGEMKIEDILPDVPFPTEDDLEQHFK